MSDQKERPNIVRYFEACDVNMNMRCWDGFFRKECLRISLLLMLVGDKENNTSLFFKLFSLGKLTWEPIDQESRRVRMAQHRICQKLYNYTLEVIKRGQKKLVRGLVTSERHLDYKKGATSTGSGQHLSRSFLSLFWIIPSMINLTRADVTAVPTVPGELVGLAPLTQRSFVLFRCHSRPLLSVNHRLKGECSQTFPRYACTGFPYQSQDHLNLKRMVTVSQKLVIVR